MMKLDHYSPITHHTREYLDLDAEQTPWRRHRITLTLAGFLGSLGLLLAVASAGTADSAGSSTSTR